MNKVITRIYPVAVLLIFIFASITATAQDIRPGQTDARKNRDLPVVGSFENLKTLLAQAQNSGPRFFDGLDRVRQKAESFSAVSTVKSPLMKARDDSAPDYSATNVQVKGVDEADVVKTDGNYIYQVNNQRVIIARAYPPEEMKIVATLNFHGENFTPTEMYVDNKYLVVIGNNYYSVAQPKESAPLNPEARRKTEIYPPVYGRGTVKALIYDISDKENIIKVREAELEGNYITSRKIGSALYLIANKYIDYYRIMEDKGEPPTPSYRDTAGKPEFNGINYSDIRYFPNSAASNYLMIGGLNLDKPDKAMEVSTYLGGGENVYASQDNLYIAVTQYEAAEQKPAQDAVSGLRRLLPIPAFNSKTVLYKFALERGQVKYTASGEVPGTVLNQFSMDEYKGYFRIATTKGEAWRNDEHTSKNNVYILDNALKITGRIEDVAPGEKIYAARFWGDRGYMVTFKTVDPLFVIDLKDPQSPKILGALKIPGYSDYLHPYDENHIIGFGKDTVEITPKDWSGSETKPMAFYQGMKIAVFDVSNVENPVEKFKEVIGDRGTDSELLRNHKALLFSKEKNLLAFPVTVAEVNNPQTEGNSKGEIIGMPQHGQVTFQGAYVYNIDLSSGFTLKGRITHHSSGENSQQTGYNWYADGTRNVERIIYINDTLYTLSKGMIKANDLNSLEEINSLPIPR